MDEHIFLDIWNIKLMESCWTNNSGEQYSILVQHKRVRANFLYTVLSRNLHAGLEKGTSRHDRKVGSL